MVTRIRAPLTNDEAESRRLVRSALARSAAFRLVAAPLGGPRGALRRSLETRLLLHEVSDGMPEAVISPLQELLRVLEAEPEPRFGAAYQRIFTHTRSADCPQYEMAYHRADTFQESQELADITGFYRAFGFACGGEHRERPDHIAVELEFLHLLSLLEALARGDGHREHADVTERAYRHFLRDHALTWMPAFARRLEVNAEGSSELLVAAARFLGAVLEAEATRLHLDACPASAEAVLPERPEEDIPGPGACGVFGQEV